MLAATTRVSTVMSRNPPTRLNVIVSSTRRSLACNAGFSSPISSRYSVPPSASSNTPFFIALASVNAPRSWPNNSDSSRASGSAAQLTAMNGPSRRALCSCRAFENKSLPVPLSPCSSTVVASLAATLCITRMAAVMAGEVPTISASPARALRS